MQVNNTLNSMRQLEERLDKSAKSLAKLNLNNEETTQNNQKDINQDIDNSIENIGEPNIIEDMIQQIEIPIAYTANAEVISVQNSTTKTLLDIKA